MEMNGHAFAAKRERPVSVRRHLMVTLLQQREREAGECEKTFNGHAFAAKRERPVSVRRHLMVTLLQQRERGR